jgi:hypothetical protein
MFFSFISPRLSIIDSQVKQKQQPKKPTRKTVSDSERLSCSQKKENRNLFKK